MSLNLMCSLEKLGDGFGTIARKGGGLQSSGYYCGCAFETQETRCVLIAEGVQDVQTLRT